MSKKIIRRAKEAAKERIRSVQTHVHEQAERRHQSRSSRRSNVYGRVLPPPPALKNWSSSPKSSGVQLSCIDEDFEAALREDEFSNPFFDEPAGWQVVEHPPRHHSHSGENLGGLDGEEDFPELEEQQGDPLLGQVASTLEGQQKDEDRINSLEQHTMSTPTSADVHIHTSNSNGFVSEHTESPSEVHLETVPLPVKPCESEEAVTMEGSLYDTKDVNSVVNSSEGHHVPVGQTDKPSEECRGSLPSDQDPDVGHLPRDYTKDDDDLYEEELMTEPGLPELPSVEELLQHGIEALEVKDPISSHDSSLSSPPSSDEGDIHFEPSSNPSAAIIKQKVEQVEVEDSKLQTSHAPSEETHGTEVEMSEAHIDAPRETEIPVDDPPLIDKPDNNSDLTQPRDGLACSQEEGRLSSSPAASSDTDSISDSRLQMQSNSHPLLTSATKHPLIPDSPLGDVHHDLQERRKHFEENGASSIGSFEYIDKDDLFPIQEDYFAVDQSKQKSKKVKPPRPSSPLSRPLSLGKRNSEGKIPPPRPNYSPNLQRNRKLGGTQGTEFSDKSSSEKRVREKNVTTEERAQVKLVKPLRSSPPNLVSVSPTKLAPVSPSLSSDSRLQSGKQPSDELSPDDFVKQRDLQKFSLSTSMQDGPLQRRDGTKEDKTVSENENATTDSEEESQQASLPMAYHLLLAGVLYLYYSLNFSDYLAGLLAGFLLVYLTLGVAFVYYVHQVERSGEVKEKTSGSIQLSESFVKRMSVDFDNIRVYQVG